ncbi:MAG: Flp pilus assembly complex ATPase component TadA [Archangiaceae bacterium]|nr:Flp pilus assembly complex ATPase component TadA [Archangiaceae bacterium]
MTLDTLIRIAREAGASDVHLEGGMPMALRVRGELRTSGEPFGPRVLTDLAREVLGDEWAGYAERGSADLSRVVDGQRCRINVLRTARGAGFAIRLLSSFQATLRSLNLHPDLAQLVKPHHGLVLITGPTGSGKTSTLAALLQELNLREARHIITVESPIEYALAPRRSFIRQREVGRDTPSFAQALEDSLREDPDVLMVGELRTPEVMRLTLSAAETGHLVLATMHSSTVAEALQRVVGAFAPEAQAGICMQLADALVGAVAQRLIYRPELDLRIPECEVLMGSTPVRALVRSGQFFKLGSALETGAADGSWTFARYGEWLARRKDWVHPSQAGEPAAELPVTAPALPRVRSAPAPAAAKPRPQAAPAVAEDGRLEIAAEEDDLLDVVAELERSKN